MHSLTELVKEPWNEKWHEKARTEFDKFFDDADRYYKKAQDSISIRSPKMDSSNVPYSALIHPNNPDSGPYGGMSFVLFPVENGCSLIAMVTGTQGLAPDEGILGRPGHARKLLAITELLNKKHGQGRRVAWAKHDPCRTDQNIPEELAMEMPAYEGVFKKYGHEIYALFDTSDASNTAIEEALKLFLDLMFNERGIPVKTDSKKDAEMLRRQYMECLLPNLTDEEVINLLNDRRYVVIEGPPGTGKTEMAGRIKDGEYNDNGKSIQFHPNITYEQFIGGLAPVKTEKDLGFEFAPKPGLLMEAIKESTNDKYLLHIDEINRGDLSKVLGETIFLFEAKAQRKRSVDLPHDFGKPFDKKLSLPKNFHVLGTMNTADRSIAIMDVAIRRRFAFVQLWPQISVVKNHGCELSIEAFERILSIFVEHASDSNFNLLPGHSYFLRNSEEEAKTSLKTELKPLLLEYLAQGYVSGFAHKIRSYLQWISVRCS